MFGDNVSSTTTKTQQSALDQEAMNTTDLARLHQLCQQGSKLACQFASMPEPSAEQKAQWADNREADAQAQREATAQKLVNVGVNPRIAEAVITGKDVIYTKDVEEIERIVRENYPEYLAKEILNDFYKIRTPWYKRTSTLLAAGVMSVIIVGALALRSVTDRSI